MHKNLIKQNLLHGIEVANEDTYSAEALQIALDNELTLIGASDIHGLIDWQYNVHDGGHRPITLVFAKDRNEKSIQDALFNRQTVVYFSNLLIGRKEFLIPLIESSLTITKSEYLKNSTVLSLTINNESNMDFILKNKSNFTFHNHSDLITIKAKSSLNLNIKVLKPVNSIDLNFEVLNGILAPKTHPEINFYTEIE